MPDFTADMYAGFALVTLPSRTLHTHRRAAALQ